MTIPRRPRANPVESADHGNSPRVAPIVLRRIRGFRFQPTLSAGLALELRVAVRGCGTDISDGNTGNGSDAETPDRD
jgi:hypothetical protein